MMTDSRPNQDKFKQLRQQAEALLQEKADPSDLTELPEEELQALIHELKVHQVELELQNEALRETQQQLEAARNTYADLYNFAPVGYLTLDVHDLILEANTTSARMLEQASAHLPGRRLSDFIVPDDQNTHYMARQQLLATGAPQAWEVGLVRASGSRFYAQVTGNVVTTPSPDTAPRRYRIAVTDITRRKEMEAALKKHQDHLEALVAERTADLEKEVAERKQGEEQLRRYADRLQILRQIDAAILTAKSPAAIAQVTLEKLRRLIPYSRASVAVVDLTENTARELVVLTDTGLQPDSSEVYPLSQAGRLVSGVKQGRVHQVADLANLSKLSPLEEILHERGLRSYVSLPIMFQEELIGALNLAADEPNFFSPDHIEIATEITNSLAIALNQARLYQQTQADARLKSHLLEEVNHRVSNNLMAIGGLIRTEERSAGQKGEAAEQVLKRLGQRVESLATLHRLLHQRAWNQVTLAELARQIIQTVLDTVPVDRQVNLTVTPSPVMVTARQASNLALIINELTTNTVKYGLADRTEATIAVEIGRQDEAERMVQFEYRDDGPGYPASILNQAETGSVGLHLIRQLAMDLGGQLRLANNGGAVARLGIKSE